MLALKGDKINATAFIATPAENIITAYTIPHRSRCRFTTFQAFRDFLEEGYKKWQYKSESQYIAIEGATDKLVESIDKNRRDLPRMRLDYDATNERLIIKFASNEHDLAHEQFSAMLTDHVRALGITRRQLASVGTGRTLGSNNRSKEPDKGFKPGTRGGANDKPTLIFEAGLSETLNQLRNDAYYWLTKTNGEVKIVLLFHIKRAAKTIELERWENRPNPRPTRSNSSAQRPTKIQELQIQVPAAGPTIVMGGPLVLPVNLIFDIIPPGVLTTGLTITDPELSTYAEEYFDLTQ